MALIFWGSCSPRGGGRGPALRLVRLCYILWSAVAAVLPQGGAILEPRCHGLMVSQTRAGGWPQTPGGGRMAPGGLLFRGQI